ncbi:hypothetical protein ABW20_dc0103528 [Dactylellina cionopaga]|nr:hypothetical protein ABW20_dc0103528 [Dactylellina cionopaga]
MKVTILVSVLAVISSLVQAAPLAAPVAAPLPVPSPGGIPSTADAKSKLTALVVRASGSGTGYSRDLFPHWSTVSGACNAREWVLKRDGTGVVQDSSCAATSGTWRCPYSGGTYFAASDIDIDHMIPLKNAWISGASSWTTTKRGQFANDLTNPQLWATKDSVNQAKSDQSPDSWKPPLTSFYCTYARSWVQVKYAWALSITSAEKSALTSMLNTC